MTNKITEAAKAAGGTTYTNRHYPGATACAFGPEALERFFTIAFKAGMERAAEMFAGQPHVEHFGREIADAIRAEAHAQNQPKTTHDGSVVSKN